MDIHMVELFGVIVVSVITAIIGPSVVEYVKVKLSNPKKTTDHIRTEITHSKIIHHELEDIREILKGDRVWITMYHNGGNFLTNNKSMKKFSMMYESCRSGVAQIAHTFTNLPVSLYSRSTEEILNKGHIYIPDYSDHSISTFGLRGAGESTNVKSSYSVGLFEIENNQCIGVLGIDYQRKRVLNEEQLVLLNEKAQRIAGYLSNYLSSK